MSERIWHYNQQKCYDYYTEPSNLFVARDLNCQGGKEFTAFKSVDSYLKWLSTQPEEKRNCYEQIRFQHTEYYDIDENKTSEYWKTVRRDGINVLDDFFNNYKEWLKTTDYPHKDSFSVEKHALILQSSNPQKKISFHITMRHGFLFSDMQQTKTYIDNFYKFLFARWKHDMIDKTVYSKNRCFRTIHCTKKDDDRILQRSNYNQISQTCKERMFFISYILPELIKASDESCLSLLDEQKKLNTLAYESNCYYLKFINTQVIEKEKSKTNKNLTTKKKNTI
jgi:Holliday junction resolvase RusA-like endonuclease